MSIDIDNVNKRQRHLANDDHNQFDETESQILELFEEGYHLANPTTVTDGSFNEAISLLPEAISGGTNSDQPMMMLRTLTSPQNEALFMTLAKYERSHKADWTKHFKPLTKLVNSLDENGSIIPTTVLAIRKNSRNTSGFVLKCNYCNAELVFANFASSGNQLKHWQRCPEKPIGSVWDVELVTSLPSNGSLLCLL